MGCLLTMLWCFKVLHCFMRHQRPIDELFCEDDKNVIWGTITSVLELSESKISCQFEVKCHFLISPCCSALFDLPCSAVWPQLVGTRKCCICKEQLVPCFTRLCGTLMILKCYQGCWWRIVTPQVVAVEGSQHSSCFSQRQKTIPPLSHLATYRDESSPPWSAGCEIWGCARMMVVIVRVAC